VNALKFKRIIYVIAATAIVTIGAQVYRSIQNYQLNKERFVNDMQQSLDVSLEAYFAEITKDQLGLKVQRLTGNTGSNLMIRGAWSTNNGAQDVDKVVHYLNNRDSIRGAVQKMVDSKSVFAFDTALNPSMIESISISSVVSDSSSLPENHTYSKSMEIGFTDSLKSLKGFAQKIVLSLSGKDIKLDTLNNLLEEELDRRDMKVRHVLVLFTNKLGPLEVKVGFDGNQIMAFKEERDTVYSEPNFNSSDYPLTVESNNTFLSKDQRIELRFENASLNILKRGGVDLLISLIITIVVIGTMMYLYGIITEQKQLAEIKNDLISNITHEFKTPIATISTAMEGISNFNQMNDPEKTAKYVGISQGQLKKLNGMVEKLLETASLDSNELEIAKEDVEVVGFTRQIFEKFHVIKGSKKLSFQTDLTEHWLEIDPFHMENAIGNLVDNAIKYGGDEVLISLSKTKGQLVWQVKDSGGKIGKQEQQRIFDKFYRIPTGNVHDVKGFGIGLYYTKTLVEKHGGKVGLSVEPNSTLFSIEFNDDKA